MDVLRGVQHDRWTASNALGLWLGVTSWSLCSDAGQPGAGLVIVGTRVGPVHHVLVVRLTRASSLPRLECKYTDLDLGARLVR